MNNRKTHHNIPAVKFLNASILICTGNIKTYIIPKSVRSRQIDSVMIHNPTYKTM